MHASWGKHLVTIIALILSFYIIYRYDTSKRIAVLTTWPPEPCGIATFSRDLCVALKNEISNVKIDIYLIDREKEPLDPVMYEGISIKQRIRVNEQHDYVSAGKTVNSEGYDAVIVQYEKVLYGGHHGKFILDFAAQIGSYIVIMHASRISIQRETVQNLIFRASKAILMTPKESSCAEFASEYSISREKCLIIPHLVPDFPFVKNTDMYKERVGIEPHRPVILSFGLISPDKGLERAFEAFRIFLASHADAVFVIVGRVHPAVPQHYISDIKKTVHDLIESGNVIFKPEYVSDVVLRAYLSAADVFLAHYGDLSQTSSGTLSWALAAGLACISTPFVFAKNVKANVRYIDWGDPMGTADVLETVISNETLRNEMRLSAWKYSRNYTRGKIAQIYSSII